MKNLTTFNLQEGDRDKLYSLLPKSKINNMISEYIVQHYQLPSDFSILEKVPEKQQTIPIILTEDAFRRLDQLVNEVSKDGFKVNRSSVMRNIVKSATKYFEETPVKIERKNMFRSFHVKKGTKERLDKFINKNVRGQFIEKFILEEYVPSKNLLKEAPEEVESLPINMDEKAFKKLDSFKSGKINRTVLMRDAIEQFIMKMEKEMDSEQSIEKQVYQYIDELKNKVGDDKAREMIIKYLDEDKCMK
jgi:metal-responsive CopG/Arc/MetJ family transcriptional regulator